MLPHVRDDVVILPLLFAVPSPRMSPVDIESIHQDTYLLSPLS